MPRRRILTLAERALRMQRATSCRGGRTSRRSTAQIIFARTAYTTMSAFEWNAIFSRMRLR